MLGHAACRLATGHLRQNPSAAGRRHVNRSWETPLRWLTRVDLRILPPWMYQVAQLSALYRGHQIWTAVLLIFGSRRQHLCQFNERHSRTGIKNSPRRK